MANLASEGPMAAHDYGDREEGRGTRNEYEASTVIFKIITFLIQKHFKTVTVTAILRKLIQMTF